MTVRNGYIGDPASNTCKGGKLGEEKTIISKNISTSGELPHIISHSRALLLISLFITIAWAWPSPSGSGADDYGSGADYDSGSGADYDSGSGADYQP